MGAQSFGVKTFSIVGTGNTTVLGATDDLKLNATGQVAITTNTSVTGVVTATAFVGDGSGLTSIPSSTITYTITANGSSAYRFSGPGILDTVDNPTLYLQRGLTYTFVNTTLTSHPFRIQFTGTTTGVGTYVSGSQSGTQVFTIPHDAPANYQYQCTVHGAMIGSFLIPS
jgi:plastocyanin